MALSKKWPKGQAKKDKLKSFSHSVFATAMFLSQQIDSIISRLLMQLFTWCNSDTKCHTAL